MRVFGEEDVEGRLARPLHVVVLEIAQVERCEGRRALCDPARRHDVICEGGVHAVADGCQRIKARRTVGHVEQGKGAALAILGIPGRQRAHEEPAREALNEVAVVENGEGQGVPGLQSVGGAHPHVVVVLGLEHGSGVAAAPARGVGQEFGVEEEP